jgi:hypothetical protein
MGDMKNTNIDEGCPTVELFTQTQRETRQTTRQAPRDGGGLWGKGG